MARPTYNYLVPCTLLNDDRRKEKSYVISAKSKEEAVAKAGNMIRNYFKLLKDQEDTFRVYIIHKMKITLMRRIA